MGKHCQMFLSSTVVSRNVLRMELECTSEDAKNYRILINGQPHADVALASGYQPKWYQFTITRGEYYTARVK